MTASSSAPPPPRPPAPGPGVRPPGWSALVLAGRRPGGDPLASSAGVSHKALLPVAGVPMLVRVLRALAATGRVERIAVSIDRPEVLAELLAGAGLPESLEVDLHPSRETPAASVLDFLEGRPPDEAVLVTTADHPLLTPEALLYFLEAAGRSAADAVAGVVTEATLRGEGAGAAPPRRSPTPSSPSPAEVNPAAPPSAGSFRRTLFPLRDERITGANLFVLRGPGGRRAAAFWRRTERLRKRPWRLVALLGPVPLALLALRRLDLEGALARASAHMDARLAAVRLPFPECAVDVDRPEHLELAARLLAARDGRPPPASGSEPR